MIGKFDYKKNCSIAHFIPQGENVDGYPVIVFPQNNHVVVAGHTYDFQLKLTQKATYTIDGVVYRVAHATAVHEIKGQEADIFDVWKYGTHRSASTTAFGDAIDTETAEKLADLKARLLRT